MVGAINHTCAGGGPHVGPPFPSVDSLCEKAVNVLLENINSSDLKLFKNIHIKFDCEEGGGEGFIFSFKSSDFESRMKYEYAAVTLQEERFYCIETKKDGIDVCNAVVGLFRGAMFCQIAKELGLRNLDVLFVAGSCVSKIGDVEIFNYLGENFEGSMCAIAVNKSVESCAELFKRDNVKEDVSRDWIIYEYGDFWKCLEIYKLGKELVDVSSNRVRLLCFWNTEHVEYANRNLKLLINSRAMPNHGEIGVCIELPVFWKIQ